jgi:hypothetical protein
LCFLASTIGSIELCMIHLSWWQRPSSTQNL